MRYCKYLIIFIVAFLPAKLFSQDITGLWKGTLYNDTTKKYYKYEIGISEEKGKLSGFSHTYFLLEDKEFYGVKKIKIKKVDGKIIVEDAGLIANNYPVAPAKNVRQLNVLTLEIKDSIMILSGPFTTNRTKEYSPLTGAIHLERKNDFWQSALVPHLQELGLSNDLSFVKKENDLIKEKEETESLAAEMLAKNKVQQVSTIEPKQVDVSKDIAANTGSVKTGLDNKIKIKEPRQPDASKEVASNIVVAKTEPAKEVKTDASKEIVSTTVTTKTEPLKEVKTNEPKQTDVSKDISSNTVVAKTEPAKANETKPVAVKNNAPAAEVANRTSIVQQTVYFTSDSLQLSLYDNGEVDGDTVSVLMNGEVIMAKERLSTSAVRKTIYAGNNSDSIELVMYAENLGAIAPNTGLLVVHDGKSIYEIRFSGDLKKNASIILRRRKN